MCQSLHASHELVFPSHERQTRVADSFLFCVSRFASCGSGEENDVVRHNTGCTTSKQETDLGVKFQRFESWSEKGTRAATDCVLKCVWTTFTAVSTQPLHGSARWFLCWQTRAELLLGSQNYLFCMVPSCNLVRLDDKNGSPNAMRCEATPYHNETWPPFERPIRFFQHTVSRRQNESSASERKKRSLNFCPICINSASLVR